MNYILMIIEMLVAIFFIILFYKKEKQDKMYLYIIIAYILSIVMSVKNIEIKTLEIPLGIILTTSIYLVSNLLVQKKGPESTKKLTKLLLLVGICIIPIIILTSSIISTNPDNITNTYSLMFISKLRIALVTAIVPFLILQLNTGLYYQLKREKNNILLNSIITITIIYFIDATIFSLLSFIFVIPITDIFVTIAIIYAIKIVMGIITIPILYIMQKNEK